MPPAGVGARTEVVEAKHSTISGLVQAVRDHLSR
jgi:hypothetical protein